MRAITQFTEEQAKSLNGITITALQTEAENENMKLVIHNGEIVAAEIIHRDYVWKTDGRKNYICENQIGLKPCHLLELPKQNLIVSNLLQINFTTATSAIA
jgi:hypothetical protein